MKYINVKNVDIDGPEYSSVSSNTTLEKEGLEYHKTFSFAETIIDAGAKILVVMSDQIEDIIVVKDKAVVKTYDGLVSVECGDEMVLIYNEADTFTESDFDHEEIGGYFEEELKDAARKEGFELIVLHQ